ncbi:protein kinase [Catenulispora sp. NF23]|uniref:protein kinase domain-containing protein n=1 Tax=Catenulispora pinistramenti TaxID=2705254 RepID=UPI001BA72FEC|nr:protein kinase [Catenulispora pinistramenti]MBS2534087.1 protein kinase [Catenulispora pinistramenti]
MTPTPTDVPTISLTMVKGLGGQSRHVFAERSTCVLGRADDCAPRLPDDEHHRTVSRHHCLLDINPPEARIRDFGSLNGTYVNGEKIGQREKHQSPDEAAAVSYPERDLLDGDEIRLGETVFRVGIHVPATLTPFADVPAQCSNCGRDVAGEIGARTGEYVCVVCQNDPGAVLRLLLRLAGSAQPTPELAPIAGYTLVRELGRGGMGAVYLARHEATGQVVGLKVMLPKAAANTVARDRFLREAKLTSTLRHPNIAALHDAGYAGGTFYFTLEYCEGGSLDRLVERRGGKLPANEAVRLAVQVLQGLEHAHDAGIVHRDLSPSNILLTGQGAALTAKVCDFGLAKAFDQAGLSGLTRTGATAGKPWYLPRQQVINFRNSSPAVDVWALAATLYRCLTGEFPRDFSRARDPWQAVLQMTPTPIREHEPSLPPGLAEVIDEALRETPAIGFQTAAEFRAALSPWA